MGKIKELSDKEVEAYWHKAAEQQKEYRTAMAIKKKRQIKGEAKGV